MANCAERLMELDRARLSNSDALLVLEGLFVALLGCMSEASARAATKTLMDFADCANMPLGAAIAFRQLAHSAEPLAEEPEPAPPAGGILGAFGETVH